MASQRISRTAGTRFFGGGAKDNARGGRIPIGFVPFLYFLWQMNRRIGGLWVSLFPGPDARFDLGRRVPPDTNAGWTKSG